MNYILFDGTHRDALLPFTFTRPVADIRIGIFTIREKWEHYLGCTTSTITEDYLAEKYPMVELDENIFINASFLPNENLVDLIVNLKPNQAIYHQDEIIAFHAFENQDEVDLDAYEQIVFDQECLVIRKPYDIFSKNDTALRADFELITEGRESEPIPSTVQYLGAENIFIEEGAKLNFVTLNATSGPIYIGRNAEVMEGSVIRGPFSLGEESQVKLGAKIYGATTIGPHCRVGGEVNNSVLFGYSNKGHDGFLGNAVLGEWCNIGADSNNSNLKNNYDEVRLWSYESESFERTGLQFCGLMMGDHSKCGINTMFNTGTVVGVSANVFGAGFPRNYIPNFTWGGAQGTQKYLINKALQTAEIVMQRRYQELTQEDKDILMHIYNETKEWQKS
ncbi:MAG TPA: GlmU family protein [Flavobacterium sp.]|nr:GlmU family protein [Flavobacterium sp.]